MTNFNEKFKLNFPRCINRDVPPLTNPFISLPYFFLVKSCKFDFEDGLSSWVRNGTAFNNQPTYGDNPTARGADPARQQGNWWIGTFEDRPSMETLAGKGQGDGIQGYATSPSFNIVGKYISFLIGGGCDINLIRAELIVGSQVSTMLHFPLSPLYKRKKYLAEIGRHF